MFSLERVSREIAAAEAMALQAQAVQEQIPQETQEELEPPSFTSKFLERGDGTFRILSLDGGGIRAIPFLKFLVELESLTKPIGDMFDLIAGTSTGGIVTLAATNPQDPHSAQRILVLCVKSF